MLDNLNRKKNLDNKDVFINVHINIGEPEIPYYLKKDHQYHEEDPNCHCTGVVENQ